MAGPNSKTYAPQFRCGPGGGRESTGTSSSWTTAPTHSLQRHVSSQLGRFNNDGAIDFRDLHGESTNFGASLTVQRKRRDDGLGGNLNDAWECR